MESAGAIPAAPDRDQEPGPPTEAVASLKERTSNRKRAAWIVYACPVDGFASEVRYVLRHPPRPAARVSGNRDLGMIYIAAEDGRSTTILAEQIRSLMRQRRNRPAGSEDDFRVLDMAEIAATVSSASASMTALLGAIAAVSLIVGGIGIMNLMLVSVTERTREIGIRLAIGAFASEVMLQFLLEAIVLSTLGGLIGMLLGFFGSYFASRALELP